jgi:hypothetical protein
VAGVDDDGGEDGSCSSWRLRLREVDVEEEEAEAERFHCSGHLDGVHGDDERARTAAVALGRFFFAGGAGDGDEGRRREGGVEG